MQKSSLPVGVKTLYKYYTESKTLDLDCPIQRASGQWSNLTASLLIHSMLGDYIIPNIYLRKEIKEGTNYLSVLEGKQRLSNVFSFIDDEWSLHAKTPNVVIDGVEYTLALKKFSELEEDLKSAILGFRFTTYQLENCTDEEIEETFARLNAGTPLSKIQQARPKMGMELADWCNKLVASDFFQKSLNLTLAQLRREDDFLMLVTGMMLLDERYKGGFKIKTSASAAECVRFAETIRNNYSQEKREDIELLVDFLSEAFKGAEYKFLKKNNIPIVMYVGQVAIEHGISEEEYLNTVVEFYENDCTDAYEEASGSGNVKMVNINIRLKELMGYVVKSLPKYFEDENEIPADFVKEAEADSENSEENEEEPTSEEVSEEDTENYEDTESEEEPKYVLFHLSTGNEEQDVHSVYEVDSTDEEYLDAVGYDLAVENADAQEVSERDSVTYDYEILEDMTREEILDEYGEINTLQEDSNEEGQD